MPKVSIVTPVYNRPDYLLQAVMSIQNQTFTDWEHIIIDDGSTNSKTREILTRISKYPNIKIYHTENKGLGAARNFGIEKAQGKFILTLDDDDIWNHEFLEKAVPLLNDNNIAAISSGMREFGLRKRIVIPKGGSYKNFLVSNSSVHGLFRKSDWEFINGYDENRFIQAYSDWDFWLRLTFKTNKIIYVIPEILFYYRTSRNSMMNNAISLHTEMLSYIIEKNMEIYSGNIQIIVTKYEEILFNTREHFNNTFHKRLIRLLKDVF